jgi:hypothetical protein
MVWNASRWLVVTALFVIALARGFWRVTLNGLFFGDYRSPGLAKDAIAEARKALAPPYAEAVTRHLDPNAAH